MYIVAAVVVVISVLVLKYLKGYLAWRKLINKIPGEEDFSYVSGNMHKHQGFHQEAFAYQQGLTEKCKYMYRLWIGPFFPFIYVCHPEAIRAIVNSTVTNNKPRGGAIMAKPYDMGVPWLGESLLLTNGERWARNRRLLTPAFHFQILKSYIGVYNDCAKILLENITKSCTNGTKPFDLHALVDVVALDVILRCTVSYHSDCQTKGKNKFTEAIRDLQVAWTHRAYNPLMMFNLIWRLSSKGRENRKKIDYVHQFCDEIIAKRKKELENEEIAKAVMSQKSQNFLDLMLLARDEDGVGLTLEEIRSEVNTFLFAGHDTTTSALSWTLYSLAKYPDIQEKVYEEVVGVMQGREEVLWDDLSKIEYTTMCIKESMRLNTPVPESGRLLEEDLEICGYTVPKGTVVAPDYWNTHHNPHVWENPMGYRPERFHPEKAKLMDPMQFIPFSAGNRNCIGQNFAMNDIKTVLMQVIRNFRLRIDPDEPARWYHGSVLQSEKGMMVYATPRLGTTGM